MIASVSGVVATVGADSAVVDVGGVGLLVHCTPSTAAALRAGERAHLATSLVVREDALTLYGFGDAAERAVFELLQTASGVGPRLAQAVLALYGPDEVRRAIATEDVTALTRVPGIGRKGAQRLVLELKDKVGGLAIGPPGAAQARVPEQPAWGEQVRHALVGLGYSSREAEDAVTAVAPEVDATTEPDVAVVLRTALRALSRT